MITNIETTTTPGRTDSFWRMVSLLVVIPVVYAVAFNASFWLGGSHPSTLTVIVLSALKILSVLALIVGVHRVGNQFPEGPSMALRAAGTWAVFGVVLVAVVAWAKEQGASLGVDHLWPGQADPTLVGSLDFGPGATRWRPLTILAAEVLAVLGLSIGVTVLLRLMAKRQERLLVTALAVAGLFLGLLVYDGIVGWSVIFDFDPFVGDAVLGALSYELVFFFVPIDPLGAIGLATIAVANGVILGAAGPTDPARFDSLQGAVQSADDAC